MQYSLKKVDSLLFGKIAFLFVQSILFFPFIYVPISENIDMSWMYEINFLTHFGFIYGRDILFTMGPLSFFLCPEPIENNVFLSWSVWGIVYFFMLGISVWMLFSESMKAFNSRKANIWGAAVLLFISPLSYTVYMEYWPTYVVIFLLLVTLWQDSISWPFYFAWLLSILSLFIKFTMGILNVGCIMSFLLIARLYNRTDVIKIALWAVVGSPLLFIVSYYWYNPNVDDMWRYVYGAIKISSGYTYNMSLPVTSDRYFILAAILFMSWLALIFRAIYVNKRTFVYTVLFLLPVFIGAKHAMVRGDHIIWFSWLLLVYMSLYVLFMPADLQEVLPRQSLYRGGLMVLLLFITFAPLYHRLHTLDVFIPIKERMTLIADLPQSIANAQNTSLGDTRTKFFPPEFQQRVGTRTMTVYPWDISCYRFSDSWRYVPIPVFPINASEPYLDKYNASFFATDDAPYAIVMSMNTVDNQYPLINCPALWQEIFCRYEITDFAENYFLLTRASKPQEFLVETVSEQIMSRQAVVDIPYCEAGEHIIAEVDATRNLRGRLAQIFYKIPAVNMEVVLADGRIIERRIFFEVWQNGVIVDSLPVTNEDFAAIMSGSHGNKVKSMRFTGSGLAYYSDDMNLTFKKIRIQE